MVEDQEVPFLMQQPRSPRTLPSRPVRLTFLTATIGAVALAAATIAVPAQAASILPRAAENPVSAPVMAPPANMPISSIPDAAEDAVLEARALLAQADKVGAAVQTHGLDIGGDATIDTSVLDAAVDKLDTGAFDISPVLYLPELTSQVVAAAATVEAETTDVNTRLNAAVAKKKAEEEAARIAAEKKAAEEAAARAAAEAAEAESARQQSSSGGGGGSSSGSGSGSDAPSGNTGGGGGGNSPADAKATARTMGANAYGWGDDQFQCLVSLWNRESGWNYQAYNSGSGATGIPQALPGSKMASAGSDWATNATTQIRWGMGYIAGRYGNPCGAWSHSENYGWY